MRSVLDPLPRFLSTRSLAILVTMFVAGIAISVHEYLESGRTVRAASPVRASFEAPAQSLRVSEPGATATCLPVERAPASAESVSTCERTGEIETSADAAPGLWIPDSRSTGS